MMIFNRLKYFNVDYKNTSPTESIEISNDNQNLSRNNTLVNTNTNTSPIITIPHLELSSVMIKPNQKPNYSINSISSNLPQPFKISTKMISNEKESFNIVYKNANTTSVKFIYEVCKNYLNRT